MTRQKCWVPMSLVVYLLVCERACMCARSRTRGMCICFHRGMCREVREQLARSQLSPLALGCQACGKALVHRAILLTLEGFFLNDIYLFILFIHLRVHACTREGWSGDVSV